MWDEVWNREKSGKGLRGHRWLWKGLVADCRERSESKLERGSRWPRMGSHSVVLNNCMSLQYALGWPQKQAHQSCFMVPGQEAGRAKSLLGWVGSRCKTVSELPHSSQLSWGRALLAAGWGADLSLPCQDEFSWLFQRKSPIYRLRAEAQVAEGALPAVHHQPCRETFACSALDSVQHWGINTAIQASLVCFLYGLTGSSAAVLCGESVFPIYLRGMFSFIVAWWSVWLRQSKKLLSALCLTSLKKEMCWKK